jgi:hypothetical protein
VLALAVMGLVIGGLLALLVWILNHPIIEAWVSRQSAAIDAMLIVVAVLSGVLILLAAVWAAEWVKP